MTISLEEKNNLSLAEIKTVASELIGAPVFSARKFSEGLNSRVYRLTCSGSKQYVAKFYFRHPTDLRDRMGVEFSCLKFLWKEGFTCIPRPIAANPETACAVYEYIDGEKIVSKRVRPRDVGVAVHFLTELKELTDKEESDHFPPASEACFSVEEAVTNIQGRIERLFRSKEDGEEYEAMRAFLKNDFLPFLARLTTWCKKKLTDSKMSFDIALKREERTLSPSDFGFHNALRNKEGRIIFFDFEYFGWDDPAKMISDFLLHPAMRLSVKLKQQFASWMWRSFKEDKGLKRRIEIVYPLFGLKWCLIFLNEFVDDDLLRRDFARESPLEKRPLQRKQLAKSKRMFEAVRETYRRFPYHG